MIGPQPGNRSGRFARRFLMTSNLCLCSGLSIASKELLNCCSIASTFFRKASNCGSRIAILLRISSGLGGGSLGEVCIHGGRPGGGPGNPGSDCPPNSLIGPNGGGGSGRTRSEEHTSELQSLRHLVCSLLLEK